MLNHHQAKSKDFVFMRFKINIDDKSTINSMFFAVAHQTFSQFQHLYFVKT